MQWTTGTPAARAAPSRRAVCSTTRATLAAWASSGKLERSPTTPRWSSMVSTAAGKRAGLALGPAAGQGPPGQQLRQVDRHLRRVAGGAHGAASTSAAHR